jgi:hypothetical protein
MIAHELALALLGAFWVATLHWHMSILEKRITELLERKGEQK